MRYCTNCGTPTSGGQAFCTQCGAVLGHATEPETLTGGAGAHSSPADSGPPSRATTWLPPTTGTETASPHGPGQPPPRLLAHPRARRRHLMIAIVAAVAVLAGGVAAWEYIGNHPARPTAAAAVPPTVDASQGLPTPTSQLTGGSVTVTVAPNATQQPNALQVAKFLETYFTAINTHDFELYKSLFEPQLRQTLQQFNQGYQSTSDSDMTLTSLSATATGLAAAVSFTSQQEPADSPTNSACTTWNITLYLQPQGSTYLIAPPPTGYRALYSSCS